jgi:hypothetical protein
MYIDHTLWDTHHILDVVKNLNLNNMHSITYCNTLFNNVT